MATSMQDVSATAVAEASDGLQAWAGTRAGHGRVISRWNRRSRPEGSIDCRTMIGTKGLRALVLLTQSFGSEERVAGVATVVSQLVYGPVTWWKSYDLEALRREINRWLSLGNDQSTTLIDEILRQYREWVMGGEEGPFAKLGEVLHHLKFQVRGRGGLQRRRRRAHRGAAAHCAALTSEHSHLTGVCHIEMAFLPSSTWRGRRGAAGVIIFVFAHCSSARSAWPSLKLLKGFRKQLSAVAFDEDLLRRAGPGFRSGRRRRGTIADAVASFKTAWAVVERSGQGLPARACVELLEQMTSTSPTTRTSSRGAGRAGDDDRARDGLRGAEGQSRSTAEAPTLRILRCRFEPGDTTTGLRPPQPK